jgi:RNA polymerase sigma-70 factor (ECF subfamily)
MSTADCCVIERVRDGDTEAFSDLVARYQKAVFGMAVSTTADVDEAEDLAQTSFIEAFARLGELRNGSRFGPWLYSIARNRCRDWLRARSRLPAPVGDPSGLPAAEATELPSTSGWNALQPSWTDGLVAALAALPHDYRTVLLLRYVADLSYEEIGQALSLSASARSSSP